MIRGASGTARHALAAVILLGCCASGATVELRERIATARATCDLEAATGALIAARAAASDPADPVPREILASSALLVAELLRVDYEALEPGDREHRLQLGRRIDTAAREGLDALDGLPDSSERLRLRGDLLATMIRSKLRAKKYRRELEEAAQRARDLDPDNPKALVTTAKPLIYADDEHGGDPEAALQLLDRALSLDRGLASALFLRVVVKESLGDSAGAAADRAELARRQPSCAPPPQLAPLDDEDARSADDTDEVN